MVAPVVGVVSYRMRNLEAILVVVLATDHASPFVAAGSLETPQKFTITSKASQISIPSKNRGFMPFPLLRPEVPFSTKNYIYTNIS